MLFQSLYVQVGETYTNTKLAEAYEKIADEGPDGFYKGEIAENIVKATVSYILNSYYLQVLELSQPTYSLQYTYGLILNVQ